MSCCRSLSSPVAHGGCWGPTEGHKVLLLCVLSVGQHHTNMQSPRPPAPHIRPHCQQDPWGDNGHEHSRSPDACPYTHTGRFLLSRREGALYYTKPRKEIHSRGTNSWNLCMGRCLGSPGILFADEETEAPTGEASARGRRAGVVLSNKTTRNAWPGPQGKRCGSGICDLSRAQLQKRISAPGPPAGPAPPWGAGARSQEGTQDGGNVPGTGSGPTCVCGWSCRTDSGEET